MTTQRPAPTPNVPLWQPLAAGTVGLTSAAAVGRWMDVGLFGLWLLALGVLLWVGRRSPERSPPPLPPSARRRACIFVFAAAAAFFAIAWFDAPYRKLPPAYHDEYSYLFQARQFLCWRPGEPSHAALLESPHFQQMHVLHDRGVAASRYFPATGFWFAPFVLFDSAYLGGWILHALTCGFLALSASRWSTAAGAAAAVLTAVSPALVVFHSAILSPGPAMLGLAVGWWGFQETIVARRAWAGALAGAGVAFAFLARPLTAVAIALPWAVEAVARRRRADRRGRRAVVAAALAFTAAPILLAAHNVSITGDVFTTPYGLWTRLHSPCHVYGFYNRTRGLPMRSPRTIEAYDDWAPELTPLRAIATTASRWRRAVEWTAGTAPVVSLLALSLLQLRALGNAALLPLLSVLLLTLAHVPFAFEGLFGFSYIVEATPFALLAASLAFARVHASLRGAAALVWCGIVVVPAVVAATASLPSVFSPTSEFLHPRIEAAERLAKEDALAKEGPVLILYALNRADGLHSTFVFNDPCPVGGARRILRAWKLDGAHDLVQALDPKTAVYECRRAPRGGLEYRRIRP